MTLIAAIADKDKVIHMIADRRMTNSCCDITVSAFPKIAHIGITPDRERMLIGAAGSHELITLCTQVFNPPALPDECLKPAEFIRWCMGDFRASLKKMLSEHDVLKKPAEKEHNGDMPGTVILAARGMIAVFSSGIFANMNERPFRAIGSGDEYFTGSMFAAISARQPLTAQACKDCLLESVRIASGLKNNVGAPYDYANSLGAMERIEA